MRSISILLLSAATASADFALKDGDTVVFLGDSITAGRGYTQMVENYTLLRYPDRRVHFINSGKGGETASGAVDRLESAVFRHHPTVVTVAYGINDIGWGGMADEPHRQKYLNGVREIVLRCRARGIRVFICSPACTGSDPWKSEGDYLQKMTDDGMALARSLGAGTVDLLRGMREIQKRVFKYNEGLKDNSKKETLHAADGIHLNDLGYLAMGFAMLKGLGAPAEVSSAALDASERRVIEARGCRIDRVVSHNGRLEFDRLDQGIPLNFGLFGVLNFRFIPIPEELNGYRLRVAGLAAGQYLVEADGRAVGKYSAAQLAAGLNISSATANAWEPGGPWDAQAALLKVVTESRNKLESTEWMSDAYLKENPNKKNYDGKASKIDDELEKLQRIVVRPKPYHFVIRPMENK